MSGGNGQSVKVAHYCNNHGAQLSGSAPNSQMRIILI
ncbi:hypothetical protein [Escherichia phage Es2]|nr:hypothetical protein [Escherichia phage Es2]